MLRVAANTILLALALSAASPASARDTLQMYSWCPKKATAPCLAAKLSANGVVDVTYAPAPDDHTHDDPLLKSFVATGRLNGGVAKQFTLNVSHPADHIELSVAFIGRSKANHPIILTDRGALEVTTEGFDDSYGAETVLIDTANWRIVAAYLDLAGGGYVATTPTDIGSWNEGAAACVEAPTNKPGMLKIKKGGCNGGRGHLVPAKIRLGDMLKVFPYVGLVGTEDENTVSSEFGGNGGYFSVFRIPKSRFLIVTVMWDHC